MKSRLLTETTQLAKVFREWCEIADDIRIVTAWATTECTNCSELRSARSKISTLVIGLDFYSTSPSFLDSFRSNVRIGKADGGATFHPKVYLFRKEDRYCCILGSSNFTAGGFGDNIELNVYVTGSAGDPFFEQLRAFIDFQEKCATEITSPEIADYKEQFERLAASRARLAKFRATPESQTNARARKARVTEGLEPPEHLNKTWDEYVTLISAQKKRLIIEKTKEDPGYLDTAEYCQTLFRNQHRLAQMPYRDRQYVGGTIKIAGWFGSMSGHGFFKQRLNDKPESLDAALDHIPLSGAVSRGRFDAFVANYQWKGSGVGTASRLLAMKRPDLFICIDSKNRSEVARAFDLSGSSLQTFEGYWRLILRVWKSPWWRSPQPTHILERRMWKARVALLDAVYYYPD